MPRPCHPADVLPTLGAIQLDSVNAVGRNHELVIFSRFGSYDIPRLRQALYGGTAFEYWGHSASWLPLAHYPLFLHRVARLKESGRGATTVNAAVRDDHPEVYDDVRRRIERDGPVQASDFAGQSTRSDGWWNYRPAKQVLEDLFDSGELMCVERTPAFGRRYDLTERVLPTWVDGRDPGIDAAMRELVLMSVRRLGVASLAEVKDYYRCHKWREPWREALEVLVADGSVVTVHVPGVRGTSFACPLVLDGPRETPEHRPVLLSPLDNLLWDRPRVKRLFGFIHKFEIYIPAARRQYGYWVMPLLADGRLQGRADLKFDRSESTLLVKGAWLAGASARQMADAITDLATHLSAESVEVPSREGSQNAAVRRAVGAS